jgi:hypothetical protein
MFKLVNANRNADSKYLVEGVVSYLLSSVLCGDYLQNTNRALCYVYSYFRCNIVLWGDHHNKPRTNLSYYKNKKKHGKSARKSARILSPFVKCLYFSKFTVKGTCNLLHCH